MNRRTASLLATLAALAAGSGCSHPTAEFQDGGLAPDGGPHQDAGLAHPTTTPQFGTPILSPAKIGITQMAAADFNGDGKQDLVVSQGYPSRNFTGTNVEFLAGNGDLTFQPPVDLPTGASPQGIAVLDIDGDGHPDFAVGVCSIGANHVSYFLSRGAGFAPRVDIPVSTCPYALAVGDFNGDGRPDLVTVSPGPGTSDAVGEVDVLYSMGGSLQVSKTLATDAPAIGLAVADLNGDHASDLVVTTTGVNADGTPDAKLLVWMGASDGSLRTVAPVTLARGGYRALAIGDVDADGHPDLVLISARTSTLAVALGLGDGTFQEPRYQDTSGNPVALGLADFRQAGWLDVATAEANIYPFQGLSIFPGGGLPPAPIGAEQRLLSDGEAYGLAIADFNGDGRPDIALSLVDVSSVAVIPALGGPPLLPDPATFKTAPHTLTPIVPYQGGPVVDQPEVITLTFQDDPNASAAHAYNDWIVGSDWLAEVGSSYGVGLGTNTNVVIHQNAPAAILDSEIQTMIYDLILDGGAPPAVRPDGGGVAKQVYFVYFPSQTTISGSGLGSSCSNFGGYHSEDDLGPTPFAYAVVPTCAPNYPPVQQISASHELIEACSDPLVGTAPAYTSLSTLNAGLVGEVGDVCTSYNTSYVLDGGVQVAAQRIWSNAAAEHDAQPCIPAPPGPYANVSPDETASLAKNIFQIAAGQSLSIPLTGWTSAPAVPFGVLAFPYGAGLMQANFYPDISMGKANLDNGEPTTLTVTVPPGTGSHSVGAITILSGWNDDNYAYWPLVIYVP